MRKSIPIALFFLTGFFSIAQPTKTIKVKKGNDNVFFYPKNTNSDTIIKNKTDLFYLVIKDKIKTKTTISVENGYLSKTANDSIFKLNYINGINYDCVFFPTEEMSPTGQTLKTYLFKTLVNGVSSQPKNEILVVFKYENEVKPFIENRFYFKN